MSQWYADHDDETKALVERHGYCYETFLEVLDEPDWNDALRVRAMNVFLETNGDKRLRVSQVREHDEDSFEWEFYATPIC